ncbi:hypothetical protein SUGI_1099820 [Cryptomeria japonica]|nr:hypothetical protein SUGI_1099820 [Cryptomeria japonica]
MAQVTYSTGLLALLFCACLCDGKEVKCKQNGGYVPRQVPRRDSELLEFPLNLEYLEAEFFLFGAFGYGLDKVALELVSGGPPPIGVKKANLDSTTQDITLQFSYQEVSHLRTIKDTVKGFP